MLTVVNARIICPRNGGGEDDRLQQRSLCRQRFVELKNTPAYRSMLQAIADRFVLFLFVISMIIFLFSTI